MKFSRYVLICWLVLIGDGVCEASSGNWHAPTDSRFQYMGRIDFSIPDIPRFWQPGVTVSFRFRGEEALLMVQDEQLWGTNQNYLELVVDGNAVRLQTKGKRDTISVKPWLGTGKIHTVILCKNTEANIGYLEFLGVQCDQLLKPAKLPRRRIECIGNSITCGASADLSGIPCGKGKWQDQHNAWMSYASVMARQLDSRVHLSSVSGIGLIHSCCQLEITMPQVFDKVSMRNDSIRWDFSRYQPDLVTICLGQNDGVQDSAKFVSQYISFVGRLRKEYPRARFLLLSSPMADDRLREFMRIAILAVEREIKAGGDWRIATYVFEKAYVGGCDYHPSVAEHQQIAAELVPVVKKFLRWK